MKTTTVKQRMSVAAFVSALIIGFIALFIPPTGIIHESVLWFTAQLLCYVAALLGVDFKIDFFGKSIGTSIEPKDDKKIEDTD